MLLHDLTWQEAARVLASPDTLVLLPIGASAKAHGPHLRLDNDRVLAEALRDAVLARLPRAVSAPTVGFAHYPAFTPYAGTVSLRPATARDLMIDIVRSIAEHGPQRFYALNTGLSTVPALREASELLAAEGIMLRWTDFEAALVNASRGIAQQSEGTHADEVETSIMLHIAPERVDMARAVRDGVPRAPGQSLREVSASGVYGDATLATREKGRIVFERLVEWLVEDAAR